MKHTGFRWRRAALRITTGLLVLLAVLGSMLYAKSEQIVLSAEAYVFGYPLVMMDLTRQSALHTIGPENQLRRVRQFPDARFRDVVRPNVDTLYTTAFIDLAKGPWVFSMSGTRDRYEVMAFLDGWTDVFAAPGTRLPDKGSGLYLLVGAQWQGDIPAGMTLLRSPTRLAWLIGRTQTHGPQDYAHVHAMQDRLQLVHLQDWQRGVHEASSTPWLAGKAAASPIEQMKQMPTEQFFRQLARLMQDNPPGRRDDPMLRKMARLGLAPGQAPEWSATQLWAVRLGRWIADMTIARELGKPRDLVQGWQTPPPILGDYGTAYNIRAVVAMVGLGANLPADALYPQARVDSQGRPLQGSHRYRLHFEAGQWPPVKAFWSITAYGHDDFLLDTARHALGSRDPLVANADGSLDLWVQADPPEAARQANWLPVLAGQNFLLNARLYWPQEQALTGAWHMPGLERLD